LEVIAQGKSSHTPMPLVSTNMKNPPVDIDGKQIILTSEKGWYILGFG
jgi:hypothetical protein